MQECKTTRNSNIELLRIFAMFLIILSHAVPYGNNNAVDNYKEFLLLLMRYAGQIGNCIFICCSAYFLLDSKTLNAKKIYHIATDTFFISIFIMLFYVIWGYPLPFQKIIISIFPITFNNNWFIGCYILYYILHRP